MADNSTEAGIKIKSKMLIGINYLLLAIIGIIILVPILIVFLASFKSDAEYVYSGIFQLPQSFSNIENYITVITKGKFLLAYKNTVLLILISNIGSILMGSMLAYIFSRFEFHFKKTILVCFLITSAVPQVTTQVATFTVIKNLHLYNTIFAGIALYLAASVLSIYIFMQFIEKVPVDLDESALVDGASYFRIFSTIILPQLKPAIATVFIIKTLEIYNDMLTPYLYMPKSTLKTVTTALLQFSYDRNSQWNVMAAGIIAAVIPTILLYLYLQRYIIAGLTEGAVKT